MPHTFLPIYLFIYMYSVELHNNNIMYAVCIHEHGHCTCVCMEQLVDILEDKKHRNVHLADIQLKEGISLCENKLRDPFFRLSQQQSKCHKIPMNSWITINVEDCWVE